MSKDNSILEITTSPHIHSGSSTQKIMLFVIIALLPAMFISIYNFGLRAILHYSISILCCMFFETSFTHMIKRKDTLSDLSAVVTGILLAMNMPVAAPVWVTIVGSFVSIVITKMIFGGIGANPFNPALVGRVFTLICFPSQMTMWTNTDGLSGSTPLGSAKAFLSSGKESLAGFEYPELIDTFLGFTAGSMGETSTIAILVGGLFLVITGVITWHIPLAFISTVYILISGHLFMHPDATLPALIHLTSGGLMLGAIFMATDYSSSPMLPMGKIIFGIGCGIITVLIRLFGNYPEGVAFSILIMNSVVPLIDRYTRPKSYGEV